MAAPLTNRIQKFLRDRKTPPRRRRNNRNRKTKMKVKNPCEFTSKPKTPTERLEALARRRRISRFKYNSGNW